MFFAHCIVCVCRRVIFIGRGDVFGQWNISWDYTWEQLKEAPVLTPKGIQIMLKVSEMCVKREGYLLLLLFIM